VRLIRFNKQKLFFFFGSATAKLPKNKKSAARVEHINVAYGKEVLG